MPGSIVGLLFLVITAWQIISAAMERRAEKRAIEEAMEAREAARRASAGGASDDVLRATPLDEDRTDERGPVMVGPPGATGTAGPPSAPSTARERAEALAARRRAQIEELRRRAAARATGQPAPTARPAPPTPPSAPIEVGRSTVSSPPTAPTGGGARMADEVRTARQAEAQRAAAQRAAAQRAAAQRAAAQRAAAAKQTKAAEKRRREIEARRAAEARRGRDQSRRSAPVPVPRLPGSATGRGGVAAMLGATRAERVKTLARDRDLLRDAIVLREILDPPLAMRDPRGGPGSDPIG